MIFNKRKKLQIEQYFSGILDSQDTDIVVVRGDDCEVLYMNSAALSHIPSARRDEESCLKGYSYAFPDLCEHCPKGSLDPAGAPVVFDAQNEQGRIFQFTCNSIDWVDEKPAMVIFSRDVDDERNVQRKLYNLAYIDQLTSVPNRQKFREDFEAVREAIEAGSVAGVVAIFDLDNFKSVNDTYGHNTGDVMLRRLTAHLEADPAFKGHLYRLGGDEFVLFYADPAGMHGTPEETVRYYENLLRGAFLTYTMPNIELACTISMGVALFPAHGDNTSELLRKADIALYKAKADGRNSMVLFEDRYDRAKKFKDMYIGMQPVMTKAGKTYGYELIDRGTEEKTDVDAVNLAEGGSGRAMDALGLGDLQNDARYFISFSSQLLSASVLKNLPKDKFVIQVHVTEPFSEQGLAKLKELRSFGYSLAGAGLQQENATPELMELVEYCKFDPDSNKPWQREIIKKYPQKKFIAMDVDTNFQLENASAHGFELFQGYFFNEPAVIQKTKDISPLKVNYYRLLELTGTDDYVDFKEISTVISSDVALSYKLLRLLNSAALGLRNQISSIDMAIAYLGEENLKQWIATLALRGIASDKPLELVRISLIRARFGELLAPYFKPPRNAKHVFLVGLFSLLHIALEKTQEELLNEMPVADEIRNSLLTKSGPYSDLVSFYSNYEYANWEEITRFAEEHQLNDKLINDSYLAAVKWYNDLAES